MKKLGALSFLLIVGLSLFATVVNASTYTSTLQVSSGYYVPGAYRMYTAGNNYISLYINDFEKVQGLNYTILNIQLEEDNGTACIFVGDYDMRIDQVSTTYTHNWGYLAQGYRAYNFDTRVNGINYGGVYSSQVIMSSGSN